MDATHAVAAITARDRTADLARQALPDATTVPESERGTTANAPVSPLRHRASLALRRLADRLEPVPARRPPSPASPVSAPRPRATT